VSAKPPSWRNRPGRRAGFETGQTDRLREAAGILQTSGGGPGKLEHATQECALSGQSFGVEGHQAFGVKLSEGNMQCPLFGPQMTLTIERQVDAFSNSDSSDASQQEGVGIEVVCSAQFLLKPFIIFR